MSNKKVYETTDIVKEYAAQKHLQKPEETILKEFDEKFGKMKMLDIGIGGGRTTYYFAKLVNEYIGIDYAKNMVHNCVKKFGDYFNNVSFKTCDARSMKIFKNDYFDFILFSFNGIDYMPYRDRIKALKEIRRVCKKDGFFFFSTHNIQNINKVFSIKMSFNPFKTVWRLMRYLRIVSVNSRLWVSKNKGYIVINDSTHKFRLRTSYIKPKKQIEQLNYVGFKNVEVYSLTTGKKIKNKKELDSNKDSWLYFLCQA